MFHACTLQEKSSRTKYLAQYLLDLTLPDSKCRKFLESEKAAASVVLSRALVTEAHGFAKIGSAFYSLLHVTPEMTFYTGYLPIHLIECQQRMAHLLLQSGKTKFLVRIKFNINHFNELNIDI